MIDLESIKRRNEERKQWEETDELLLPAPLTTFEEAIRDIDALVAEVERLRAEMDVAMNIDDAPHGDNQGLSDTGGMHLGPTALQILEQMRRQPGTFRTVPNLCKHVDCTASDVRIALAQLERLGFVDRGHTADGAEEYMLNPTALPR